MKKNLELTDKQIEELDNIYNNLITDLNFHLEKFKKFKLRKTFIKMVNGLIKVVDKFYKTLSKDEKESIDNDFNEFLIEEIIKEYEDDRNIK